MRALRAFVTLAIAIPLLLGACGGDDTTGDPTTTTAADVAAPESTTAGGNNDVQEPPDTTAPAGGAEEATDDGLEDVGDDIPMGGETCREISRAGGPTLDVIEAMSDNGCVVETTGMFQKLTVQRYVCDGQSETDPNLSSAENVYGFPAAPPSEIFPERNQGHPAYGAGAANGQWQNYEGEDMEADLQVIRDCYN